MTIEEVVTAIRAEYPVDDSLLFNAVGLSAEAGELLNLVKKHTWYADYPDVTDHMIDELSDVFFHVAALCMVFGITLDELATYVVTKQSGRLHDGTQTGNG